MMLSMQFCSIMVHHLGYWGCETCVCMCGGVSELVSLADETCSWFLNGSFRRCFGDGVIRFDSLYIGFCWNVFWVNCAVLDEPPVYLTKDSWQGRWRVSIMKATTSFCRRLQIDRFDGNSKKPPKPSSPFPQTVTHSTVNFTFPQNRMILPEPSLQRRHFCQHDKEINHKCVNSVICRYVVESNTPWLTKAFSIPCPNNRLCT